MYVYFCLTTKKPYSTCSELRIGRAGMSVKEDASESHNRYPFSRICDHQKCHSICCKLARLHTTCSDLRIGRVRMSVKEDDSESHNRYPFSWICDHQTCHSRFCKLSKLHITCSDLCTATMHTSVTKIWFGTFLYKKIHFQCLR